MKTKNVIFAGLTALSMTLSPVATCVAQLVTPVYAAEATQTYATPNGVADFGKGNASITITPNAGQSLVGKTHPDLKATNQLFELLIPSHCHNIHWHIPDQKPVQPIPSYLFD